MLNVEHEGLYVNVYAGDDMIVSVSEEHSEIVVYRRDGEEPVATHDLE